MWRTFILIYVICLSGATFNHARELWQGGWLPYHFATAPENAFWTALTFIDPLTIALLLWRPRWGVWLATMIIVTDVAVNTRFSIVHGQSTAQSMGILAQVLFMGFVLGSAPWVLRELNHL